MDTEREVVWVKSEPGFYAFLVKRGAYYSEIEWESAGVIYTDTIENDDYEFWKERAIEFDTDAD